MTTNPTAPRPREIVASMALSRIVIPVTALAVLTLAACSSHGGTSGAPRSAPPAPSAAATTTPPPDNTPAPGEPASPLSGRGAAAGLPVLAVKIDNVPGAFPQAGLNDADLVYVEQVEGGLTRLTTVFSSRIPSVIGPVRSARTDNIQLLMQYGRPAIAFSGANAYVLRAVRSSTLKSVDFDRVPTAYARNASHPVPHNLFITDPKQLIAAGKPEGAKDIGLTFTSEGVGGAPARHVTVRYPATTMQFDLDPVTKRWFITQDGQPKLLADGSRAQAGNVILQSVTTLRDVNGAGTPFNQTIGGGKSIVLRDGRATIGTWGRHTVLAGTHYFDANHKDVGLRAGVTWVVLVPTTAVATVSY